MGRAVTAAVTQHSARAANVSSFLDEPESESESEIPIQTTFGRYIPAYYDRARSSLHMPHPSMDNYWMEYDMSTSQFVGNNHWVEER